MSRFSLLIILRVFIIFTLGFAGIYFALLTTHWLLSAWFFIFVIIGIYDLIRYLEKSKRDLSTFLIGIKQNDFSNSYLGKVKSKSDQQLYEAFQIISDEFRDLRKQKEANFHFLQAVVEHSGVAMIGYREDDEQITLMNQAAKDLFEKPFTPNLEAFNPVSHEITSTIRRLKSSEKELVKVIINNRLLHLSIIAKELVLDEQRYKLVSFHNIKAELDEKELEAWQKLIRVLTHEIKNSAIPISTLTDVINQMILAENGGLKDLNSLSEEEIEDIRIGMQTVHKRSKGLVNFVESYGKLAKVPEPEFNSVNVEQLLKQVKNLTNNDLKTAGVKLEIEVIQNLLINADAELIEQVLINLVKNAKEALTNTDSPLIRIKAFKERNTTIISIHDNGPGIPNELMENIFIPFYTTKKEGSGIGLSLSRQIMKAHKGSISVSSDASEGTTFYLRF